jgi:hypothetical protein
MGARNVHAQVFATPATRLEAVGNCSRGAPPLPSPAPLRDPISFRFFHLATFHGLTTGTTTPLVTLVKQLAAKAGVPAATLLWTGARVIRNGTTSTSTVTYDWADDRPFDSNVTVVDPLSSAGADDGYEVVLNLGGAFPVLQTLRDVNR